MLIESVRTETGGWVRVKSKFMHGFMFNSAVLNSIILGFLCILFGL